MIRFPFAGNLNSRSGPDVLVAAITEAARTHPAFRDLNAGPIEDDDITWFPVGHSLIPSMIASGRRFAIGPNVIYGLSYQPGASPGERALMDCDSRLTIFCLSRWYAELIRRTCKTQNVVMLDYPLSRSWLAEPPGDGQRYAAFLYVKGGSVEARLADEIAALVPGLPVIRYGHYQRAELWAAARESACCVYLSREDNYPLAAVEINLMGCPIVSDEKSCPVVAHGITGLLVPCRERGEREPFAWALNSAVMLARAIEAAGTMPRDTVRRATVDRHDPARAIGRAATALSD